MKLFKNWQEEIPETNPRKNVQVYWWLVELPMWLMDGFSVTIFGRWRGQWTHMLIPVWLTYGPIHSN